MNILHLTYICIYINKFNELTFNKFVFYELFKRFNKYKYNYYYYKYNLNIKKKKNGLN